MSPPAQNDFPTARMTSAPTSGSRVHLVERRDQLVGHPGVSALRRSGAFSVTIATPPSTSSSTSPDPATSPPSCRADRPRRRPHLSDRHQTTGPHRPRTGQATRRPLADSTSRHSAFTRRSWSGVRTGASSSSGLSTTTASACARDTATFSRFRS